MPIVGIAQLGGDPRGELARDAFEHDRVRARFVERARVGEHALRLFLALALHLEAAHRVHALRREADVAHHRDAGGDDAADRLGDVGAALELDRVHAALGQQPAGVAQRLFRRDLVAHERHVADDVRALAAARDRAAVVDASRPASPAAWCPGPAPPCRASRRRAGCRRRPRRAGARRWRRRR